MTNLAKYPSPAHVAQTEAISAPRPTEPFDSAFALCLPDDFITGTKVNVSLGQQLGYIQFTSPSALYHFWPADEFACLLSIQTWIATESPQPADWRDGVPFPEPIRAPRFLVSVRQPVRPPPFDLISDDDED